VLPPPVDDLGVFGAAGVAISVPLETFLTHRPRGRRPRRQRSTGDLDSP
jgi:hypothetical protein